MAKYLIGSLTADYWYLYPEVPWLTPGHALGDALRDLKAKRGVLSVFEVDDDASPAHIERIVVAIAAKGKEEPVDIAYRLFDPREVTAIGIQVDPSVRGTTGDDEVNGFHRNLGRLSAERLARLANVMATGSLGEVLSKNFTRILKKEVAAQRLKLNGVNRKLRDNLGL